MVWAKAGQIKNSLTYCTLRKIDPVLTELALSNILKKLNNILEPILDLRY